MSMIQSRSGFDPANRVLLVEDEPRIRDVVCQQLARVGYSCEATGDGHEGLQRLLKERFDVIVLDLMLPGIDGLTICRTIRGRGPNRDAPVLMLTARDQELDKLSGFDCGADDYVTKPFSVLELIARVAALQRRVVRQPLSEQSREPLSLGGVKLDPSTHTVYVRRTRVDLTPHEFELLYRLASQPGVLFTRKDLLTAVWRGQAFVTERSIDTLVRHLRRKVEADPAQPQLIVTVWGYGYKFGSH
jgi:two-component system, OmpR family, response regulator